MRIKGKWLLAVFIAAGVIGLVVLASQMGWLQPHDLESLYQTQPVQRGDVAQTIEQTGSLRARQSAVLTWKTDGKVGEVFVQPGDSVQKADILARLDPAELPSEILQAQSALVTAKQDLAELQSSNTARASASEALSEAASEVKAARDDVALLDQPNASPSNILAAQAGVDLAKAQLTQAEQFYAMFEAQPEDSPARLQAAAQVETARRQLRNAEWNLQFAQSKPNASTRAQALARLEMALAVQADALRAWERIKDSPPEEDFIAAQARVDAAHATLALQEITAPFSGTILTAQSQPGDLVQPGLPAFALYDLGELFVEIPVPEVDINLVKTGQTASLTFDAVRLREYLGVVTQVAASGDPGQGIATYTVTVRLINPDAQLHPGLTAAVNIITNQAEDTLLVPNSAVRLVKNQRVVYVLRNGQPVPVSLTTGISDQINTQVIAGLLQEGDNIILNPGAVPTETQ